MAGKTLFDHLGEIFGPQRLTYFETLTEEDRKTYVPYMINRFISMTFDYLPVVNELQQYTVGPREQYLFYSQFFPKKRSYDKYVKAAKAEVYDASLIELIGRYFGVSQADATAYLTIFYSSDAGKDDLRSICRAHGFTDKQFKKVKL